MNDFATHAHTETIQMIHIFQVFWGQGGIEAGGGAEIPRAPQYETLCSLIPHSLEKWSGAFATFLGTH